jgi:DNA-binding transcriptional ArsR family regulator
MSSTRFEQVRVRDVMAAGEGLVVEARAGAAFELLIGLSVLTDTHRSADASWVPELGDASASLRRALERIGDVAGETWLHLLGLAIELPAVGARGFVEAVDEVEPIEFRRHLVGVHVPAWRSIVGGETLERAAAGDRAAVRVLLESDRYYAGRARDSLSTVLPLIASQTKRRFVLALRHALDVFEAHEGDLVRRLEEDARARRDAARTSSPEAVIAAATGGYVYEPEPEFRRVVLIPHVAASPALLLCQHRDERLICYPARDAAQTEADSEERVVRLGKALGDPARVRIVRRLVRGEASLGELAEVAGVAKSTAHHHLAALRAAGLVTLRGNARGYWYTLRVESLGEARSLVTSLFEP